MVSEGFPLKIGASVPLTLVNGFQRQQSTHQRMTARSMRPFFLTERLKRIKHQHSRNTKIA